MTRLGYAWTDICSSVIAPALLYYTPSMALYNICIHHIHADHAGGTTPWMGEVEQCMEQLPRAKQARRCAEAAAATQHNQDLDCKTISFHLS